MLFSLYVYLTVELPGQSPIGLSTGIIGDFPGRKSDLVQSPIYLVKTLIGLSTGIKSDLSLHVCQNWKAQQTARLVSTLMAYVPIDCFKF